MLILSRNVGQKLVIGDDIVVLVKRVTTRRVVLGVDAPQSIRVVRSELQKTRRLEARGKTEARNSNA